MNKYIIIIRYHYYIIIIRYLVFNLALPPSAEREKGEKTEWENQKGQYESLCQDTNFTPILDQNFNANTRPLETTFDANKIRNNLFPILNY